MFMNFLNIAGKVAQCVTPRQLFCKIFKFAIHVYCTVGPIVHAVLPIWPSRSDRPEMFLNSCPIFSLYSLEKFFLERR